MSPSEKTPAAGSRAATDSQARRYRTPLPSSPIGTGTGTKPRNPAHLALAAIASAIGLLLICWQFGMFDSYAGGHPGLRWRATFQGAAGGPWTLVLDGHDLTVVSPSNQTHRTRVRQDFERGGKMRLSMSSPHPQLGAVVTISSTRPVAVTLENDTGTAEALP